MPPRGENEQHTHRGAHSQKYHEWRRLQNGLQRDEVALRTENAGIVERRIGAGEEPGPDPDEDESKASE